jgi:hypothetical protein
MELLKAIRRDADREGLSIRALSERYEVHRRTVRQALASATPPPRKKRTFPAPRLDPVKPLIDAMLREDLTAPRKRRHSARRVLARRVDEHQVGDVSYSTVRDYVAWRRPEIVAEAGRTVEQAFVPRAHLPGAEGEVDFPICGSICAGSAPRCSCSRCGCYRANDQASPKVSKTMGVPEERCIDGLARRHRRSQVHTCTMNHLEAASPRWAPPPRLTVG